MPNLRVIHDNAANRSTLTASTTAGSLVAANMLTDIKSQVHRSTGTSVSYTLTWATAESIGGAGLPASNLTASATIRMRAYDAESGGTLLADTGTLFACPGLNLGLWDWSIPLNANAFAYGGASKSSVWFADHVPAKRVLIDLVDTENPAGYIDCARIVCGLYWEPEHNPAYGLANSIVDTSENRRNDSGDLLTSRGTQHDSMALQLEYLQATDRARLMHILRGNGVSRPVFINVTPESEDDSVLEQDLTIYGKRENGGMSYEFQNAHNAQVTIEGW